MTKTIEQHFADWEGEVFGFGYGSGEEHVIGALKIFMEAIPDDPEHGYGAYDYENLEKLLGPTTAWLLINVLCQADILDYGTSPRYAWLSRPHGAALHAFVKAHTVDELVTMTDRDPDDCPCYPEHCNCGPQGYSAVKLCHNPFWEERT